MQRTLVCYKADRRHSMTNKGEDCTLKRTTKLTGLYLSILIIKFAKKYKNDELYRIKIRSRLGIEKTFLQENFYD